MKVLFICHDACRTGAPLLLLNLLKWLKKNANVSFEVLLLRDGPLHSEFAALAPVHIFPEAAAGKISLVARVGRQLGCSPGTKKARDKLVATLRQSRFNVIHSSTITTGRALEALAPLECPVVTHVHELNYWIEMSGELNLQQVKKYTTRYIAGSAAVKDNLVRNHGLPAEIIDIVHDFIPIQDVKADPSGIRQNFGIPEDAFVVTGSGHETWRKGKDLFVQLAAHVHKAAPDLQAHFLWVGGWQKEEDRRNILHDIKVLGLAGKVHFTGSVTNTHNYFAAGDIFTLVSREDPFPLVCLEAAFVGKPVLCFADAGGMPEFVGNDAGFIVPYLDIEEMSQKIVMLANNPELLENLGRTAQKKIEECFNIEVGAKRVSEILAEIKLKETE
jgi:glycosyltransferase involved in cell wall biosynthesis